MAKSLAVVITHSLGWKTSDYFFLTNHRPRKSLPQNQWPIRGQYPRHVISQDQSEARKLWPRERLIDLSVTEGGTLTSSLQFSSFLQFLRSDGKCPVDTGTAGGMVFDVYHHQRRFVSENLHRELVITLQWRHVTRWAHRVCPQKRTTYFQFRIVEITIVGRVLERAGANAYNTFSGTQFGAEIYMPKILYKKYWK